MLPDGIVSFALVGAGGLLLHPTRFHVTVTGALDGGGQWVLIKELKPAQDDLFLG